VRLHTRTLIMASATVLAAGLLGLATGTSAVAADSGGAADLTIVYRDSPSAEPVTWALHCPSGTGTHPDPVGACARLDAATTNLFAPTPPGILCLQVWGGPQTAQVFGQWRGSGVYGSFNLVNGCEIHRWKQLVPVLPKA
jgi:hypothetical protein